MDKTFRSAATEMFASFVFVLVAAGVVCANAMTRGNLGWTGIALANCFAFMALMALTGHISGGHVSPAVTIGHLFAGRVGTQTAVFYIVAQLAGAIAAGLVTRAIFPASVWKTVALGAPDLANAIGPVAGTFIEALFTCLFVTVAIGCAVDERISKGIAPLAVGGTLGFCTLVAAPLTGAGLNPARAFGSAIGSGVWNDQWPFWVGPIIGAVCAPFVYRAIGGGITTGLARIFAGPMAEHDEPKVSVRSVKR